MPSWQVGHRTLPGLSGNDLAPGCSLFGVRRARPLLASEVNGKPTVGTKNRLAHREKHGCHGEVSLLDGCVKTVAGNGKYYPLCLKGTGL